MTVIRKIRQALNDGEFVKNVVLNQVILVTTSFLIFAAFGWALLITALIVSNDTRAELLQNPSNIFIALRNLLVFFGAVGLMTGTAIGIMRQRKLTGERKRTEANKLRERQLNDWLKSQR